MFFNRRDEELVQMLRESLDLIKMQREMLMHAAKEIADWQDRAIDAQRATRDIAIAFRLQQDHPEIDIRDDLDELVRELKDSVAQFEEHMAR